MAEIVSIRTPAEAGLVEEFDRYFRSFVDDPAELALREEALARFLDVGLPSRRYESWKYTDLRVALKTAIPVEIAAEQDSAARRDLFAGASRHALRITRDFAGADDDIRAQGGETIAVKPINFRTAQVQDILRDVGPGADDPLLSLNTAMALGGVEIDVPAGAVIERPLHLEHEMFSSVPHYVMPRSIVRVGEGAQATVLQSFTGQAGIGYRTNAVTQFVVGAGAKLRVVIVQDEPLDVVHVSSFVASLGEGAELDVVSCNVGASLARLQFFLTMAGEKASATLNGVSFAGGKRHLDSTLVVDHAAPGGVSRELFKAVLDGEAKSVFQGKIVVRQIAQQTDGKMMSRSLLLSDDAEAYNKPELEIFADDVVCGHGATVAALDDELLFYCMSRGIPREEAESLLLHAFVGEIIDRIDDEVIRGVVAGLADTWLTERR